MDPFNNPTEPPGGYSLDEKIWMFVQATLFLVVLAALSWVAGVLF